MERMSRSTRLSRVKMDVRSFATVLVLLSPSLLVGPVRKELALNLADGVVPPFGTVLIALFILTMPWLLALWYRACRVGTYRRTLTAGIMFSVLVALVDLGRADGRLKALPFLLTAMPPLYMAVALHALIGDKRVQKTWLLFLSSFTVYLAVNICVWATYLAPGRGPSYGLSFARMGGSFAPEVLLGYLIAAILPMKLYLVDARGGRLTFADTITIGILLLSSFLTGSRGSVWLSLFGLTCWVVGKRHLGTAMFLGAVLGGGFAVSHLVGVEAVRLTMFEDPARTSSWQAALVYWSKLPLLEKVVGSGWGRVYPYQEWLQAGAFAWENRFYLGEMVSIVHPHNAFIWALVEGGLVGVILFFWPVWEVIASCAVGTVKHIGGRGKPSNQTAMIWLALAMLILNNVLDAGVIHSPNVALVWWFSLFSLRVLSRGA